MDESKVDMFLIANGGFFDGYQVSGIREQLLKMEPSKWIHILSAEFKDPAMIQIVSIVGGHWGIDRFMIGETGLGVAKLLTCGGFGIWTIVDWFMIQAATRQKNIEKFSQAISW